jgi:hypothetical protein
VNHYFGQVRNLVEQGVAYLFGNFVTLEGCQLRFNGNVGLGVVAVPMRVRAQFLRSRDFTGAVGIYFLAGEINDFIHQGFIFFGEGGQGVHC